MESVGGRAKSMKRSAPSQSSSDKRQRVSRTYFPPPSRSPTSVTITTANGEKIELVGDPPNEDRTYVDYGSLDDSLLRPCRVRRNYACKLCEFASTNPRHFLYHQRDVHGQKGSIHECPFCMYASIHSHKLLRHISLVHRTSAAEADEPPPPRSTHGYLPPPPTTLPSLPPISMSASPSPAASPFANLSGNGVPLPPDLEVILVEEDVGSSSPSSTGSAKTLRPMLMEPSVVVFPLSTGRSAGQQQRPPHGHHPSLPPLHRRKIHHPSQRAPLVTPLPPPPMLSSARTPPTPSVPSPKAKSAPQEFSCSKCAFKSKSRVLVQRHENVSHLKKKFFRCLKCSYVTNVRARYTKHVRYHSMPYIKCESCNFSTPYKSNLDRHRRNHLGTAAPEGAEVFRCYRCNFWTLSKQSLSVHLLNHHADGGGQRRRRRIEENATETKPATDDQSPLYQRLYEQTGGNEKAPFKETIKKRRDSVDGGDKGRIDKELESKPADDGDGLTKPYACVECGELFSTDAQLNCHVYEYHETEPPEQKPAVPKKAEAKPKVKCDLCPYEAKWISEVVRHRRVHIHEKPYSCPHCEFSSRWKGDMSRHIIKYHMEGGSAAAAVADGEFKIKVEERAKETSTEVDNIEQFLDQSMMIGGEELHFYNERNASGSAPEQDLPLDLSRPILEFGHGGLLQDFNKDRIPSTGLLPFLLRMPLRRPSSQGINAPIHLSPSVQLIPTTANASPSPMNAFVPTSFTTVSPVTTKITSLGHLSAQKTAATIISRSQVILPRRTAISPRAIATVAPRSNHSMASPRVTLPSSLSLSISMPRPMDEQAPGSPIIRKKYQCPYCSYATTTASRFHMHIVVHLNQKPYMCTECGYRSNWQWDITKHAKMKASRDPRHNNASVVVVNDTGSKNYEKYEKYAVYETINPKKQRLAEPGASSPKSLSSEASTLMLQPRPPPRPAITVKPRPPKRVTYKCKYCEFRHNMRRTIVRHMSVHSSNKPFWCGVCGQSSNCRNIILRHCQVRHGVPGPIMQRDADNDSTNPPIPGPPGVDGELGFEIEEEGSVEANKREASSLAMSQALSSPSKDISPEAAEATKPFEADEEDEKKRHKCSICPYRCRKLFDLRIHSYMHKPHEGALFKCLFCPFYVSLKRSWLQHMKLHVEQPHEYVKQHLEGEPAAAEGKEDKDGAAQNQSSDLPTDALQTAKLSEINKSRAPRPKRYICEHCPYRTSSHTTFLYHRQFHRPGRSGAFKCNMCSYSVSKLHLLGQHIRMHELVQNSDSIDDDPQLTESFAAEREPPSESPPSLQSPSGVLVPSPEGEVPRSGVGGTERVWVHRDGVFLKMFKCRHCPHVSKKKSVIMGHEKLHFKRKPTAGKATFNCQYCNYACKNAGILTSHLKVHRQQDPMQVYINESDFSSDAGKGHPPSTHPGNKSAKLALVREQLRLNGPVVIPEVQDVQNSAKWYKRMSSFPHKQYFSCGFCPAKFMKPHQVVLHRTFHGANLPWRCDYCTYSARHRPHLHNHLRAHTADYQDEFVKNCNDCIPPTKKIKTEPNLNESSSFDSNNNAGSSLSIPGGASLLLGTPSMPRATTKSGNALNVKMEPKKHRCPLCPASFIKYSTLVYHLHLHESNSKYKCPHCTYSVANVGNLVRHSKVHCIPEGEKVVVGGGCDDDSSLALTNPDSESDTACPCPGTLLSVNLTCPKCPATFDKQSRYDLHMSLHGSKQRFQCDRCDYAVQYAANLVRHRRMHAAAEEDEKNVVATLKTEGYTSTSTITNSFALNGGTLLESASGKAIAESGELLAQPFPKRSASETTPTNSFEQTAGIRPAEKQHVLLQRMKQYQSSKKSTSQPSNSASPASASEPKKMFRCERCPYSHQRKDTVQSHMKRHVLPSTDTMCPHCDYGSSLASFLKEHIKLHFKPFRFHQVDAFAQWDEFEIWARYGDVKTLIYRCTMDGHEFTEDDIIEMNQKELLKQEQQKNERARDAAERCQGNDQKMESSPTMDSEDAAAAANGNLDSAEMDDIHNGDKSTVIATAASESQAIRERSEAVRETVGELITKVEEIISVYLGSDLTATFDSGGEGKSMSDTETVDELQEPDREERSHAKAEEKEMCKSTTVDNDGKNDDRAATPIDANQSDCFGDTVSSGDEDGHILAPNETDSKERDSTDRPVPETVKENDDGSVSTET